MWGRPEARGAGSARSVVFAGAVAALGAALLAVPATPTAALPTASDGTACAVAEPEFCVEYGVSVTAAGALDTTSDAAAPVDLELSFTNVSLGDHTAFERKDLWFSEVFLDLMSTREVSPLLVPSSQIADGALFAGSAEDCEQGADNRFLACTAGYGRALMEVTGSPLGVDDGIRAATFGIHRIRNVAASAEGTILDLVADLSFCVDIGGSECGGTGTATVPVRAKPVEPGSPRIQLVIGASGSTTVTYGLLGSQSVTGDFSFENVNVALKGVVDGKKVIRLPAECGTVSVRGSGLARMGLAAGVDVAQPVAGCPLPPTNLFGSGVTPLLMRLEAGPAEPGLPDRDLAHRAYLWDFGDGTGTSTITPQVQHSYPESRNYTVTLVAVDDQGARSTPVTVRLFGTRLTVEPAVSTTRYGKAKPVGGNLSTSRGGVGGADVSVYSCQPGKLVRTAEGTATTATSGDWSLPVTLTRTSYLCTEYLGGTNLIGTVAPAVLMRVRHLVTVAVNATSVRSGGRVRFSGYVPPTSHAGETVLLQRRVAKKWKTLKQVTLDSEARYRTRVKLTGTGKRTFRVVMPADTDHLRGASKKVVIRVG